MPVEEIQLNRVWARLRKQNPTLPRARIIVAPTRRSATGCNVDWSAESPVVLIPVSDDPAVTLAALLHQAAHALAPGGGLGTSAHNRWHTREYVTLAEFLGLQVSGTANTITVLNGDSADRYATELALLKA